MKHKGIFIPVMIVGSIVVTVLTGIGVANLLKFAIYRDYYSMEKTICKIPEIDDGFVPQGLTVIEEQDKVVVGGYTSNGQPSPVYITDKNNHYHKVTFTVDGKPFKGHSGGLCVTDGKLYIANGDGSGCGLYDIDLSQVLDESVSTIELDPTNHFHEVDGSASFVFTDDTYIYVGEFHDGSTYVTHHPYQTKTEGTHYAIVRQYAVGDITLEHPIAYYSIRNKVQGFAIGKDGDFILSTSWGISSSQLYMYKASQAYDSGETLDGVPVYILEDHYRVVSAPPMSEDIDYNEKDNLLYTVTESASNKYIFGKFFNAKDINALALWGNN